jgi:hypothetical protein
MCFIDLKILWDIWSNKEYFGSFSNLMKFQNSHAPSKGIIQYTDFKPHYLWNESSFWDKVYRNRYSSHCRIFYLVLMWFYSKFFLPKMYIHDKLNLLSSESTLAKITTWTRRPTTSQARIILGTRLEDQQYMVTETVEIMP